MRKVSKLTKDFTVINNKVIKIKELSLQAKGLYLLLVSLPENWNFSEVGLTSLSSNGRDSLRTAIQELEKYSLVKRVKYQDEKGHWDTEYQMFDNPTLENPVLENPTTENPTIYKELNNKENNNKRYKNTHTEVCKVLDSFSKEIDVKNKRFYNNHTQKSAADFLITEYGLENVLSVVSVIPQLKKTVPYFPSITTPLELLDKWTKIKDAIDRVKENTKKQATVIW